MQIPSRVLHRSLLVCLLQLVIAGGFLFVSGCKNIYEANTAYRGLITVFSQDLEEIGSIQIDEAPGCLMTFPGHLIVATKEGNLLLYDTETLDRIGIFTAGPAAPEGYSDMVYIPQRNSAYLIGSYGNILEIDLPACTVEEVFSVCQLPLHLVYGGYGSSHIYVSDGINNTFNRVRLSDNTINGFHKFDAAIRAVAQHSTDSILISSGGVTHIASVGSDGLFACRTAFSGETQCMGAIQNSAYTAAVIGGYIGLLSYHLNEDSTLYVWTFDKKVQVEGSPIRIGSNELHSAYLLSYTGSETITLCHYDYLYGSIQAQVELQGFPLDIEVTASNTVFVLTAID